MSKETLIWNSFNTDKVSLPTQEQSKVSRGVLIEKAHYYTIWKGVLIEKGALPEAVQYFKIFLPFRRVKIQEWKGWFSLTHSTWFPHVYRMRVKKYIFKVYQNLVKLRKKIDL